MVWMVDCPNCGSSDTRASNDNYWNQRMDGVMMCNNCGCGFKNQLILFKKDD